jgi:CxxC motif-containing protein (DUF1111 family)
MYIHSGIAKLIVIFLLCGTIFILGCEKILPPAPPNNEILEGPLDGLTSAEQAQFQRGDEAFAQVFTNQTGLGPLFVSTSCISCHAGDGKGHPSTTLVRFGQSDETGNAFLNQGGPQLQNRSIPGYNPEQIPAGASSSKFTPPANTGLGFIELVSDADILTMADPNDSDGDGISGVPNWKPIPYYLTAHPGAISQNGHYICRFGKKAGAYSLLHQTVNAYNQDMGINSVYEDEDTYSGLETDAEVPTAIVNDVVFYLQTLKAPQRRNENDAEVISGNNIFNQIGCDKCHKQTLKTGYSPVSALSYKEFHPYTDLLLHDMGTGLDDGYTEGSAKTYEWRTPPLWGLGLAQNSQGGQYYLLHDGRAQSIEEAVLMHGGEAEQSRTHFSQLSEGEKQSLIRFLESL